MSGIIQQKSGSYAIGAMALGDWTYGDSDIVTTDTIVYNIPDEKMPIVTELHFEGTTLHITPVNGASGYIIRLFGLNPDTNEWISLSRAKEITTTSNNLARWFEDYQGQYPQLGVKVKTMSPDFSKAASDFSELCIYNP